MKKVLVLGGSGFVGAHVCEKLVRAGWYVTVPTRRWNNARNVLPLPLVTVLEAEVHDDVQLDRLVAGQDAVVNLVAILHGSPAAFDAAHVALAQKIGKACKRAGVKQVVHISALGVDDEQPQNAPSHYLRSKGLGEIALRQAGSGAFDLTILRPSVIFGAEDQFLNVFARIQALFWVVPLAGADAKFQPVWVQDVASAVVQCLQRGPSSSLATPRVLELCGTEVFTLKQLMLLAGQLRGVREGRGTPVIGIPHWAGWLQALLMECAPGQPMMSRDNLNSMRKDNVGSGRWPGLASLGISPAGLRSVAQGYLGSKQGGLLGIRKRDRHPERGEPASMHQP
jgi:NADH dehydrogenase